MLFDAAHVRKTLKMEGVKRAGYHLFNGGNEYKPRYIEAPSVSLKKRQRWIVKYLFEEEALGDWIHGYVKGKSILSTAELHTREKQILRMDIKNFFPSITGTMVENLFVVWDIPNPLQEN